MFILSLFQKHWENCLSLKSDEKHQPQGFLKRGMTFVPQMSVPVSDNCIVEGLLISPERPTCPRDECPAAHLSLPCSSMSAPSPRGAA